MPITVGHGKIITVPDSTNTDIVRPSDWNSAHNITFSPDSNELIKWASAGANSISSGTLRFSNSNGVSFGMDPTGVVTASHNALTTAALSDHSHGNPTLALTNLSGTTASNSGGFTISLSAGAGGAGDGVNILAAGTQTANTTGTVLFSNSNGVTFGMSNNSVITASHNGLTSQSNQALSAANGSFTFQTASFANSNGVSFSTGTQGLYATVATNYQSQGAYLTTARASNDAVGLNTALTAGPLAWTVNSSGISLNAGSAAGTSSAFAGNLISGSMTHNTAGLNVSLNHPAWLTTAALSDHSHGNPTLALTNLSGTTASASNGLTISLSAAAPGAGGGFAAQGSGTYTQNTGTIQFANSNGITFGLSTNQMTASHNGLTTAALSNHSHGNPTLALTNLSGTTASNSAGLTLSLSAAAPGGGAGATVSVMEIMDGARITTCGLWNNATYSNRPIFIPFELDNNLAGCNTIRFLASRTGGTSLRGTIRAGIYSRANLTSYNMISSTSQAISMTTSALFSGIRIYDVTGLSALSLSPGRYALGLQAETPATVSWGLVLMGGDAFALGGFVFPGTNSSAATNSQSHIIPGWGVWNDTTNALPAAVAHSSISGGGSQNSPDLYAIIKAI